MSGYVVEIEHKVYLASWDGDPGRTLLRGNAKRFKSVRSATYGLYMARKYRDFPDAVILEVERQPADAGKEQL